AMGSPSPRTSLYLRIRRSGLGRTQKVRKNENIFKFQNRRRGISACGVLPMVQAKFQQHVGNAFIIVTQDVFGTKKIASDAANTEAFDLVNIGNDRLSAFRGVALPRLFGNRSYIHQGIVKDG